MTKIRTTSILVIASTLMLLISCKKEIKETSTSVNAPLSIDGKYNEHGNAAVAVDWYNLQLRIILHASPAYSNTVTIHLFAYTGVSLYEAAHYVIPHAPSLSSSLYQMPAMPDPGNKDYIWNEVVNANLAQMTRSLFPVLSAQSAASIDSLEHAYEVAIQNNEKDHEEAFTRSQLYGRSVATAILNWSTSDLFNQINAPYTPPVFPGAWVPTPPAFAPAAAPYFGNVRPFFASHSSGLAPAPPFPYSTVPGSDFYNMVKDLYDVSFSRTTDETNMALFWNDVGAFKGYTPSGHAINILNHIIMDEHLSLGTAIQCYAKAGMGMWDAGIMCWRSKFTYNQLRPVTYIRNVIDPTWSPLIPTPPHPEYPAAHAYVTTGTMVSIASVIGDHHIISDHTYDFLGFPARNFTSLYAIGQESGMSRRFGGIHYLPSINTGIALGKQVGLDIGTIDVGKLENKVD